MPFQAMFVDQNASGLENIKFSHAHRLDKPYGVIEPMLNWCRHELQGEWRWQLIAMSQPDQPGDYAFYFDQERDYLAFVMKWA